MQILVDLHLKWNSLYRFVFASFSHRFRIVYREWKMRSEERRKNIWMDDDDNHIKVILKEVYFIAFWVLSTYHPNIRFYEYQNWSDTLHPSCQSHLWCSLICLVFRIECEYAKVAAACKCNKSILCRHNKFQ